MPVTSKSKPSNAKRFPKLMQSTSSGLVVLFTRPNVGTVVQIGGFHSIGQYSKEWDMDYFVEYNGTVELSNV